MQETTNTLAILVQAGAVGISLALIWLVYKLITVHINQIQETINHNTDAWNRTTEVLANLAAKIDKL